MLLAVEVVSPASRRMDRMIKPSVLAEAGVPAYWRVELEGAGTPSVVVYELAGAVYREVTTVRSGESAWWTCRSGWSCGRRSWPARGGGR